MIMCIYFSQECMPSSSTISLLCLEDTPSRSQRCFAVYHNNVIIYNLLNGSCVGHLKELHPREITAVLFFNPLKVMYIKNTVMRIAYGKYLALIITKYRNTLFCIVRSLNDLNNQKGQQCQC